MKKIYENSVRKLNIWYMNQDHLLCPSAQQGRDFSPDWWIKKTQDFLSPQISIGSLSFQEGDNFSVSFHASSCVLLRLNLR